MPTLTNQEANQKTITAKTNAEIKQKLFRAASVARRHTDQQLNQQIKGIDMPIMHNGRDNQPGFIRLAVDKALHIAH